MVGPIKNLNSIIEQYGTEKIRDVLSRAAEQTRSVAEKKLDSVSGAARAEVTFTKEALVDVARKELRSFLTALLGRDLNSAEARRVDNDLAHIIANEAIRKA